nr:hypothetical protein [uncultured Tyzzerella sp.]
MASWEVDVNGKKHTIEWRPKRKNNVIIDGEPLTIKTNNPLVGGIDYEFKIEDTVFNLAGIGKIVRLAVNGTYLDTNEPYEPLGNLPTWITVLGIKPNFRTFYNWSFRPFNWSCKYVFMWNIGNKEKIWCCYS